MKRKYAIMIFASLLLMASACKDFLDLEPKSEATDENFWKSQDDANAAVSGMYALLRQAFNSANGLAFYAYGDLPSDEIISSTTYPFNDVTRMNWNLAVAASDVSNPMYLLRRYDNFYKAIDQANRVIQRLPEMDASLFSSEHLRQYYLGEAYFVRAFMYFYMTRIWGGVPILTEPVPPVYAENHPAATADEVLAQCHADIQAAQGLLDWENPNSADFAVRANKGALFALQAHVSAWEGNYQACSDAADSIIQSNGYFYVSRDSLMYNTIYKGKSIEGIFEIAQDADNEGTRNGIGSYTLVSPYYRNNTTNPILYVDPARVKSLFKEAADKRLKFAFDTTLNINYSVCTKYANVTYSDETANATAIFKNNIVIFRYSDIKLLKAEALAALNKQDDAIEILNEIRAQAGLPGWSATGDLIKEIFDERARELFLEGHRYYDQIRLYHNFKQFDFPAAKMPQGQFLAGKYLWPFDPSMLDANPLLRQTPYWATVNL